MSLFDRFPDEAAFREQFVKHLLVKLGFVNISDKHGRDEFGKDYVFSEIDRFGHYRHMVVQAKHEKSIGVGRKADELVSQVRRAFNVPYHLPQAPHVERRTSAVYVFNSGAITEPAIIQIRNDLERAFQPNVYFFDGGQLELLANGVVQRHAEVVRERLDSFGSQLFFNQSILGNLATKAAGGDGTEKLPWDMRELLTRSVEDYITNPISQSPETLLACFHLWNAISIVRAIMHKYATATAVPDIEARDREIQLLKATCDGAMEHVRALRKAIQEAKEGLPSVIV
jgi:hypothetical protein